MKRVLPAITALLLTAPLQASEPPATLPKEFLTQLPLLMSLSEQEFEGLLASAQQLDTQTEAAPRSGVEEKKHED